MRVILILSVGTILLFPLYTVVYERAAFTALHRENIADEAMRLATHLSSAIITGQDELTRASLPESLITQIRSLEKDPHFLKIKIFAPSGEVLYSTQPRRDRDGEQAPLFSR